MHPRTIHNVLAQGRTAQKVGRTLSTPPANHTCLVAKQNPMW